MNHLNRIVAKTVAVAIAAMLVLPISSFASHSKSPTRTIFDVNNDGNNDTTITFRTAGIDSYWTTAREDRLVSAVSQWAVYTNEWNPAYDTTAAPSNCYALFSCHGVWIDGTDPAARFGPTGPYAYNRSLVANRGSFLDIEDSDIFFWTAGTGHPAWNYSLAHPGTSTVQDFQGILTHEMGHSNGLAHTPTCTSGDPNIYTMCPGTGFNGYPDSYRLRTITSDDIASIDTNIP